MTKNKTEGYLVIITNYNFNRKYYLHRIAFNEKFNLNNCWDSELIVETNSRNKLKMFLHLNGLMKINHFRRLPSKYSPAEPKKICYEIEFY